MGDAGGVLVKGSLKRNRTDQIKTGAQNYNQMPIKVRKSSAH